MTNPICVIGNAIHESHCNPTMLEGASKDAQSPSFTLSFFLSVQCFVLGYVIKDESVISSSKHEMCSHVFHLSPLYHFRAQSQWLKGDGMEEVKITLFNTNSEDESWSSTLIDHLALPSPPLAAAEVWSRSCWLSSLSFISLEDGGTTVHSTAEDFHGHRILQEFWNKGLYGRHHCYVCACVFGVFRALNILNWYV